MRLLDLSLEVLIHIVEFDRSNVPGDFWQSARTNRLRELATTCKAFNDACSPFIFRSFTLALRDKAATYNAVRWMPWDADSAREKLAALRRKNVFVRSLTIEDGLPGGGGEAQGQDDGGDGVGLFPEEIMPELLDTLRVLRGLINITFYSSRTETTLPLLMWNWLRESRLGGVKFVGWWKAPAEAEPITELTRLSIEPYGVHTAPLISLIKTPEIHLEYSEKVGQKAPLFPYKPGGESAHLLRKINIDIIRLSTFFSKEGIQTGRLFGEEGEPTKDIFDFSHATKADVLLKIGIQPDPNITIEEATVSVRETLKSMLCEDQSKFDIKGLVRSQNYVGYDVIWKASPGWKPEGQNYELYRVF